MALPDMTPPSAPGAREAQLRHSDGSTRRVFCTDVERPFPEGRLIVSRTDLQGVITHANEAFVEMSGYERAELIGAPQHVLRHPDMPRAAFKDLWDTVQRGEKWHGYVKNLCKDGSFYWVYATVIPNVRNGQATGYTSVRRKPSRRRVEEAEAQYQQWLAQEAAQP